MKNLSKLTHDKIEQDYKALYKLVRRNNLIYSLKDIATNKTYALLGMIAIVVVIYLFGFFLPYLFEYIRFLSWINFIVIENKTVSDILEKRIANLATIIGVSLTVSTLLINNLTEKEKNFKILFQETFIFPVVFFVFVVLFSLILTSLFVSNKDLLSSFLVIVHYLILLVIIAIGFLFSNIINFSNLDYVRKVKEKNLQRINNQILYDNLFYVLSKEIYTKTIVSLGFTQFNSSEIWKESNTQVLHISAKTPDNQVVTDIKLGKLIKNIKKLKSLNLTFSSIGLPENAIFPSHFQLDNVSEIESKKIQDCFISSPKRKKFEDDFSNAIKYYDELLNETAIEKNKVEIAKMTLQVYNRIFSDYFKYANKLENHIPYAIQNIDFKTYDWIEKSLKNDSIDTCNEIIRFNETIRNEAIDHNSIKVFHLFNKLPILYYFLSSPYPKHSKYLITKAINHTVSPLKNYLWNLQNTSLKIDLGFVEALFIQSSKLAFETLKPLNKDQIGGNADLSNYIELMTMFRSIFRNNEEWILSQNHHLRLQHESNIQIKEKLLIQEQPIRYYRYVLFGIKAWGAFLYEKNYIEQNKLNEIWEQLKINNYYFDIEFLIKEYINLAPRNYLYFDEYDYIIRPMGKAYSPLRPHQWFPLGFVLNLIETDSSSHFDLNLIPEIESSGDLYEIVQSNLTKMEDNLDKWLEILNINTQIFNQRKERILLIFLQLKDRKERTFKENIANDTLSIKKINDFKNDVFKNWQSSFHILNLFEHYNHVKSNIFDSNFDEVFVIDEAISKEAFIDKNRSVFINLGNYGREIAEDANQVFLETILSFKNDRNEIIETPMIENSILQSIENLSQKGYKPDTIIIPYKSLYKNNLFANNSNFKRTWELYNSFDSKIGLAGKLGEILIIGLVLDNFKDVCIVSDFCKSFSLEITESTDWQENRLMVEIEEFTEEAKQKMILMDSWTKNNTLNPEETLLNINNHLRVWIGCKIRYQIINKEAFEVYSMIS